MNSIVKKIEQYKAWLKAREHELDDLYIIGIYPLSVTFSYTPTANASVSDRSKTIGYDLKDFPMELSNDTANMILSTTSKSMSLKNFKRYEVRDWYNLHILTLVSLTQAMEGE